MTSLAFSPTITVGAIRVSTDMQVDRYGPDRQREDITLEAERAGLTITDWVEESVSGTDHDRAAENRYYQLARQHPGVNVIFSHPNRVGRHVEVTVGIARTIHQLGGTVWIAGMGSLRDRRNWKYFLRDAADAESDHSDIVERLQRGKYAKALHNRWPHGSAPYGYRIVRDERGKSVTLEPHPEYAPIVQQIFKWALAGEAALSIAARLVKAEVRLPRAHKTVTPTLWRARSVRYILQNATYTGRREFRGPDGELAVVTFEPLVSQAEWQQVSRLAETRRRHQGRRTRHPALFAGHTRCTECGGTMAVFSNYNTNKKGEQTRYVYYRCRNSSSGEAQRLTQPKPVCKVGKIHRMAPTDELGWQMFCEAMSDPAFLAAAVHRDQPVAPDHSGRITEIKAQMAQATLRAVTHNLPDDVLRAALEPLQQELTLLERDAATTPLLETPDMTELAAAMADYLPKLTTLEERRAELDTWKARLHLAPGGPQRIEITVQH